MTERQVESDEPGGAVVIVALAVVALIAFCAGCVVGSFPAWGAL